MITSKINILLIVWMACFPLAKALAEGDEEGNRLKGRIEGTILDAATGMPMEYVNIILFSVSDSSMVTGSITHADGSFILEDIPFGNYYLTIEFIGFLKRYHNGLVLDEKHRKINLGNLSIGMNAIELQGAEVTAEKMAVEYKVDRKVINVTQDLDVAGASAIDVLEKTPSVKVDIDGNVSLRGSSNFKVYVDGKPSILESSEILQQIPAGSIQNIEIITNPSVKFDPDGTAGIININLKKEKIEGLSGLINASAGTGDKYSSDIFLNYQAKTFSAFGSITWRDWRHTGKGEEFRETYNSDTVFYRESATRGARLHSGLSFRGGIDYYLTGSSTLSVGGEYGNSAFGMDRLNSVHEYSIPGSAQEYYSDDNMFRWDRHYYSLSSDYVKRFAPGNHNLKVSGFFSNRDAEERQDKKEIYTDADWNPLPVAPFLLRSSETGPGREYRLEADYVRPAGEKGIVETGLQVRIDDDREEYTVEHFDYDRNTWTADDQYTMSSHFNRNIYAAYVLYANQIHDFEYKFGLRGEYTYRTTEIENTEESVTIDRPDYFPSVHLSRKLGDKNQFMASYSRRIERPRGYFLEPNETYIDETTRRAGNPELLPEYTSSWEIGYLRTLPGGNFSADFYYRNTRNTISRFQTYNQETGIMYYTFDNLNHEEALGMEATVLADVTKWLNLNLSATYYYYSLEDRTSAEAGRATSNNWDSRAIAIFKYRQNTRFQINMNFESPTVTAQGKAESSWSTDITLRQELFRKKFSMTLKMSDIFETRKREYTSRGEGFYVYEFRKPESRVVTLTLSYRINNFKQKPPVAREAEIDGDM
ncbi:MAG: TonB-dependent receptor [Bacteroidales bacterium]|nr:TonB-dependent receptor [Bacteroidales bacterium]